MTEEMIKGLSLSELKKEDFNKLKKWNAEKYSKIRSDLRLGFIGLAKRNSELLELNKKLSQQFERAEKTSKIVKTGLSGADGIIGPSHTREDFGCSDYICVNLDVIARISSTVGLVLANCPPTNHLHLTVVTEPVTLGCRSVR